MNAAGSISTLDWPGRHTFEEAATVAAFRRRSFGASLAQTATTTQIVVIRPCAATLEACNAGVKRHRCLEEKGLRNDVGHLGGEEPTGEVMAERPGRVAAGDRAQIDPAPGG